MVRKVDVIAIWYRFDSLNMVTLLWYGRLVWAGFFVLSKNKDSPYLNEEQMDQFVEEAAKDVIKWVRDIGW